MVQTERETGALRGQFARQAAVQASAAAQAESARAQAEQLSRKLAAARAEVRRYQTRMFAFERTLLALKHDNAELETACEQAWEQLELANARAEKAEAACRRAEAALAAIQQTAPETPAQPERPVLPPLPLPVQNTVRSLHARWAAEEAAMRRSQPGFDLKAELKNPEMRRLMQLPGMRVQDAYRLAHYEDALRTTAQTVEQGVVERVQQRAARPLENGLRPGAAASVRPDVAAMTRAQREALERRVLHGAQIEL